MRPSNLIRAIIDATVDRGLREVSEDPKRSIRKLTDMGRRYSGGSGRFLDEIYAIMQDLLRNDESPYYTAIEHLLRNTDRKHIKHFGINMGYHSLSFGGKVIRRLEEERDISIPWCLVLHYDPDTKSATNAPDLSRTVDEGEALGIYTYILRCDCTTEALAPLLDVLAEKNDASFICLMPDGALDENLINRIGACTNTLFMFHAQSADSMANTERMKRHKLLYGMYDDYSDETAEAWLSGKRSREFLPFESSFVLLAPTDDCSARTRERMYTYIKQHRMRPKLPFIVFDLVGDFMEINRIVSDHIGYFERTKDGDIRTANATVPSVAGDLSLEEVLALSSEPE